MTKERTCTKVRNSQNLLSLAFREALIVKYGVIRGQNVNATGSIRNCVWRSRFKERTMFVPVKRGWSLSCGNEEAEPL